MENEENGERSIKIFSSVKGELEEPWIFPKSFGLLSHLKLWKKYLILVRNNRTIEVFHSMY